MRERARAREAELKEDFRQIRLASQGIREVFRPFLSELQKLRAVLEADPSLAQINAERDLILDSKDKGCQVQQGLDRILVWMNAISAELTPADASPKP